MTGFVWVLGGYQSDFARNLTREGGEFSSLATEVLDGTFDATGFDPSLVQSVHVGNAFGQLFTGQGQLGAMAATVDPRLWGVPASRHEAACASGSMALLAATAELEAGRYDVALVLGLEIEKSKDTVTGAQHLGAAAWIGHEGEDATYMWPYMFSSVADEYDRRYGIDNAHLRAIGELNLRNARSNPNAQTRGWQLTPESFGDDDTANPVVEGRLRRTDCSNMTDGGAGVILVSDRFLQAHPDVASRPRALISGWGHTTVSLDVKQKFERSADEPYVLPHVRTAIDDSFKRAGIAGVDDLDLVETHDCFSMSEYAAIDHYGVTEPGESWKAIENGDLERDGRIPFNPSGGLIGGGHPVGATGVRMMLDSFKQVTGQAGDYQIDNASRVGALNFGGSTATTAAWVVSGGAAAGI
ncbi:thiolase domain-containing protein [Nocardioides sp. JQ2195]|uniref:acetyl-CoA acetyltransferase n=1 Tax=Nocardioides sp. JQ2195 TaxID=2592334 RepID=UPI00143E7C7C|nr:acetyl-CoA acetyltransferase [Nocardioides sp. JQ2195]QIX25529.1 thiolase domain-containing protein [Nocardioides sp. JQ2195]